MAIEAPKWAQRLGAVPTSEGWSVDRGKGRTEIVKRQRFTAAQIAEWHGEVEPAPLVIAPAPEPVMQTLHEAPVVEREVTEAEVEWHAPEETDEVESVQTHEPAWWSRS